MLGTSTCSQCGRVLQDGEQVVAFPASVGDRADPLYPLSDTASHAACFHRHPLAQHAGQGSGFC